MKRKNGILRALAYASGKDHSKGYRIHIPSDVNVAKVRGKLKLSQAEFSQRFGFNPASVKDWEQGRSTPPSPVRAYLVVIEKEPEAVERALQAAWV